MEVDDDMEPAPNNFPLVENPSTGTLLEGQTWGWDGIDLHAVVAQNQNEPYFKNGWIPQRLSYIDIFLHFLPLKWLVIFFSHKFPGQWRGRILLRWHMKIYYAI